MSLQKTGAIESTNILPTNNPNTMRAAVLKIYGAPDTALEVVTQNIPTPKSGELLVKVMAASINPIDCRMRTGYGKTIFAQRAPLPIILGRDFSGTIVKVGENVTHFKEGDAVWGIVNPFSPSGLKHGSHSEFICVPQDDCTQKPENLDFVSAASIPYVALTTWHALITQNGMKPEDYAGKKVLVHAGAGGVGTFAIQFLKQLGAKVTTTCSTDKVEFVRSLGVDEVIDYQKQNYPELLHDYDIVYDLLGKEHTDPSLGVLISTSLLPATQAKIQAILMECLADLEKADDTFTVPQYKAIITKFDRLSANLVPTTTCYVSIVGPMMPLTDNRGFHPGMREFVVSTLRKKAEQLSLHGRKFNYAVFEPNKAGLEYITRMASRWEVRPQVSYIFTLDQISDAHKVVDTGHTQGKVVLKASL